ncbi:unnamed protein product [Arctia plantaginis]|uniref:Uncharacterized protein n=1 Tax=Arctia plantaginis TaxID=874455 RepID=A0A8S0ZH03_ARCPL|nr:unnamed protein product [Arctia plantaginis]
MSLKTYLIIGLHHFIAVDAMRRNPGKRYAQTKAWIYVLDGLKDIAYTVKSVASYFGNYIRVNSHSVGDYSRILSWAIYDVKPPP